MRAVRRGGIPAYAGMTVIAGERSPPNPTFVMRVVIERRRKGVNRYETYAILLPKQDAGCRSPPIYAIRERHGLNRLTSPMQQVTQRSPKEKDVCPASRYETSSCA